MQARARYVERLNRQLARLSELKLGNPALLQLCYQPALGPVGNETAGDAGATGCGAIAYTAQRLVEGIARLEHDELRAGMSLIGPQRDDLSFGLEGRDLRSYGSQGEQRLAALLILIGMLEDLEAELGTPPVVLLDDMVAELDRRRRSLLWDFLQTIRAQVFLSGTELTAELTALCAAAADAQVWRVQAGKIIPQA
jgi:DNA replication and repair protein RecF